MLEEVMLIPAESHRHDFITRAHLEPPFAIGNIVMLNSGGPKMMIVENHDADRVTAAWLDETGQPYESSFPRVALHRVSPI